MVSWLRLLGQRRRTSLSNVRTLASRADYVRLKPNINVGTLGAAHHGKTNLASLLSIASKKTFNCSEAKSPNDIDNSAGERQSGHSQNASHLELYSEKYHIALSDLPGMQSFIKNLIAHLFQLDVVLLNISGKEGVTMDTKTHYQLAKYAGVEYVIPIINYNQETKDFEVKETDELLKEDLMEFISAKECDNTISCTWPSAFESDELDEGSFAKAWDIFKALDAVAPPKRSPDSPLFWPLEQIGNIPGRGMFAAGRIQDGSLKVGDSPDIFYEGNSCKLAIRDLEIFKKGAAKLEAGDRGGAFFKMKKDFLVKRGAIIVDKCDSLLICKKWMIKCPVPQDILGKSGTCVIFAKTHMIGHCKLEKQSNPDDDAYYLLLAPLKILAKKGDPLIVRVGKEYFPATFIDRCDR